MIKIGDIIRDIENGDCYYEGIVISLAPVKYRITNIIWNGEIDSERNGDEIELKWWHFQVLKHKWVNVNTEKDDN
tara:strand:+ start:724 stop:948 length:225 start_codon:yes stop_codon:yes gene_type:complete